MSAGRLGRLEALGVLALLVIAWICARTLLRRRRRNNCRKDQTMTELPIVSPTGASLQDAQAAGAVDAARVVTSVVDAVDAHPDVPAHKTASVAAAILAGLAQAQPAIFAVTRAGARTQAQVSLGLTLAEVILGAFLQRKR